jgi:hypothetical protein
MILASIRERAADPINKERTGFWLPKAELITKLSSDLVGYIENLKQEKQVSNGQSRVLYETLIKYKNDILNLDSSIRYEFEKTIVLATNLYDTIENGKDKFYSTFFKNASLTGTTAMLSNIQNSVRVNENKLLSFCNSRTTFHIIHDYFPTLLVAQNSTNLRQGEMLEIKAGIGRFSYEHNLSAFINGNKIQVGEEGYFTYKTKVSENPGKYKMPVKISFLNRNSGKDEIQEIVVVYTVSKPCDQ